MWVEYRPEDPATSGDGGRWEFNPNRVLGAHAEMIERRFGAEWEQFTAAVVRGSMKARRILLWYFRMLQHPGYRLEDLPDFYVGELVVSFGVAELREIRANVEKASWDTEEEREQAITAVDSMLTEAIAEEEAGLVEEAGGREVDEGEGKAHSPSADNETGSPPRKSRVSSRGSGAGSR